MKYFWLCVMVSTIIWYVWISIHVGIRGYGNIMDMLEELESGDS